MQQSAQIQFRNIDPSDALQALIHEKISKLERLCDRIIDCQVAVEATHRSHQHGNLYRVRIDLALPNKELVVSRVPDEDHSHEDVYVAVRDAFATMVRQLTAHLEKEEARVH